MFYKKRLAIKKAFLKRTTNDKKFIATGKFPNATGKLMIVETLATNGRRKLPML